MNETELLKYLFTPEATDLLAKTEADLAAIKAGTFDREQATRGRVRRAFHLATMKLWDEHTRLVDTFKEYDPHESIYAGFSMAPFDSVLVQANATVNLSTSVQTNFDPYGFVLDIEGAKDLRIMQIRIGHAIQTWTPDAAPITLFENTLRYGKMKFDPIPVGAMVMLQLHNPTIRPVQFKGGVLFGHTRGF